MTEIQGIHGSGGMSIPEGGGAVSLSQVSQTLVVTLGPVGEVLAGIAPGLIGRAAGLPDFGGLVEPGEVIRLAAARENPIDVGVDPEVANLDIIASGGKHALLDRLSDEIIKSTFREEK
jgi:hypothetical protein